MGLCKVCNIDKPKHDFYASSAVTCKACYKSRVKAYRQENAKKYIEYDRARAKLPHRVEARKEYAKTEKGKLAIKKAHKKYIEQNPLRRAAHVILNNALRDGKVQKMLCFVCGLEAEAHHPDYDRPLDVMWLCSNHHREAHNLTRS